LIWVVAYCMCQLVCVVRIRIENFASVLVE